ncbi:MAG: DUF309 domain-containing protein [Candidatus Brocadia sp.]|nr:DUF309 domain-containing protein [Candidatus Brocadia sp.]
MEGRFSLRENHLQNLGITYFNNGKYFEAHETWKDQWRCVEKSPEK